MDCARTRELLDAYCDGELDVASALDVERHLGECSSCAAIFAGLQQLHTTLQSASLRHRTPTRLAARVQAALRREVAPRRRNLVVMMLASAAAAALVLAVAGMWLRPGTDQLAREVAAAHIRSLLGGQPLAGGVVSSDRHTVKPWFAGRLDYSPPVPDLTAAGFPLIGGRLDYLEGRPAAALVYERRKHVINLFVWPAQGAADSAPRLLDRQGYHLLGWQQGGMTWWAVSDLNAGELRTFVAEVRERTR